MANPGVKKSPLQLIYLKHFYPSLFTTHFITRIHDREADKKNITAFLFFSLNKAGRTSAGCTHFRLKPKAGQVWGVRTEQI